MNETKIKILELATNPITLKEIVKNAGIKYANLSKHVKGLKRDGLLFDVGTKGNFKIIQTNKYKVKQILLEEIKTRQELIDKMV